MNSLYHLIFSTFSSVASSVLYSNPMITGSKRMMTLSLWNILLPTIMLTTNSLQDVSLSGEDSFVVVKFLSVALFNLVMDLYPRKIKYQRLGSNILSLMFGINILEATITQAMNISKSRSILDNTIDLSNSLIGLRLIKYVYNNNNIEFETNRIYSNYSNRFIICYTLWNLLFRIQLIQNSSTLIFLLVSLVTPLYYSLTKKGDWLQIRGYTLLFLMIITFGLTHDFKLLPMYNKKGYNPEWDNSLFITWIQKQWATKLILLLGAFYTL